MTFDRMSLLAKALNACVGGETLTLAPDFVIDTKLTGVSPPSPVVIDCSAATISREWVGSKLGNLEWIGGRWLKTLDLSSVENVSVTGADMVQLKVKNGRGVRVTGNTFRGACILARIDGADVGHNVHREPPSDCYVFTDCCDVDLHDFAKFGVSYVEGAHPDVAQFRAITRANRNIKVRNGLIYSNSQGIALQKQQIGSFADIHAENLLMFIGFKDALQIDGVDGVTIGNVVVNQLPGDRTTPILAVRNSARVTDLGGSSLMGKPMSFTSAA